MSERSVVAGALGVFALAEVVDTLLAIGHYEDRITVVTHGGADLPVAHFAYALAELLTGGPPLGLVRGIWVVALLAALAAVIRWRRPRVRQMRILLGAAVGLKLVALAHQAVAAPPDPMLQGFLNTRPIAYPLWILATIGVVIAAVKMTGPGVTEPGPGSTRWSAPPAPTTDRPR